MIVVDTSTLVTFFVGGNHSSPKVRKALGAEIHWAAPEHQPAEFLNVLRGLVLGRKISQEDAASVLERWSVAHVEKLPYSSAVVARIWELRHSVSAYDAAYVAVAEAHDLPLVTSDARLAGAPGLQCELRQLF